MQVINNKIFIGKNIIQQINFTEIFAYEQILIVTDPIVANLHLNLIQQNLSKFSIQTLILPGGEENKTWLTLEKIIAELTKLKFDRTSSIISLGGGIIGDLAGLAASLYMRGINWIQIPTTLLAQVDSAIGGKTGCNHLGIKNLLGTFYQPHAVIADVSLLQTLPYNEYVAGLAEVVKYGIACDGDFFFWLEQHKLAIKNRDTNILTELVTRCIAIKLAIVTADPHDKKQRMVLNYGHSFAHALEAATDFKCFLHGEAVAIGMLLAARVAVKLDILSKELLARFESLIVYLGLPSKWDYNICSPDKLINFMRYDKKHKAGQLNLILPCAIGKTVIYKCDELDILLEESNVG